VNLTADRRARESDCSEIRSELDEARGHGLLRGAIRRHLRDCPGCREYAESLARRRRHFRAVLPFVPSLALKHRALEGALGIGGLSGDGGSTALGASLGGLAEVAGGVGALAFKVAAGGVALSVTAGVGVSAIAGSQRSRAPVAPAPRTVAAYVVPIAALQPPPRRPGDRSVARDRGTVRRSSSSTAPSKATPFGNGATSPAEPAPRVVVGDGSRMTPVTTGGEQAQAGRGAPIAIELKRQEKATEREAGRGKSEQAQESRGTKAEEHANRPEEPHGNSEEHRAEAVAKGPPTEEEQQQKSEAHVQKQEEQQQAHPPKG
jgi:hypothetical protein